MQSGLKARTALSHPLLEVKKKTQHNLPSVAQSCGIGHARSCDQCCRRIQQTSLSLVSTSPTGKLNLKIVQRFVPVPFNEVLEMQVSTDDK